MITLLGDAGYIFNPETQDLQKISSEREAISRIYIAPEDCKVRYFNEEYTAKKGDLIILFYDGTFKHKCIIVTSNEWLENINDYNERQATARKQNDLKKCPDCNLACNDECCSNF